MGNPLDVLSQVVDFEIFRKDLETTVFPIERKSNAGRPPKDPVFMFKVLVLQRLYGLQDGQTEYQIKDRMSFRQFLGIENVDDVPDQKTIWKFKEILSKSGIIDTLFKIFHK